MALSDEGNGGLNVSMPVQPMYGNGGNYGNNWGYPVPVPAYSYGGNYGNNGGFFGGDLGALLVLFLFGAMGGWGGFGGMGMGGFGGLMGGANLMMWPWLMTNQTDNLVTGGFNNSGIQNQLSGISSAVTSGFGDVQLGIAGLGRQICETGGNIQNSLCSGFAGVNANISNTAAQGEIAAQGRHSALTQQLYNNELNSLNRSFAEQTANTAAINGVSRQLADCCCENRLATVGLQNVIQTENAADRAALSDGIRDVLTATQAQNQRILDKLCDQELQAERRENAELRTRLNMADLAASQAAQTAALVADNTAQTQYIVNRVAPYPIPAFPVGNPYGYNNGGWGNGYGWNNGFNPFGNVGFGNGSF